MPSLIVCYFEGAAATFAGSGFGLPPTAEKSAFLMIRV